MKRRVVSLLLSFAILFTLLPVQAFAVDRIRSSDTDNPFRDVEKRDWYYDAVQYVRINGFFYGTDAETFSPDGNMTRGMFVTVLGRMAGVDPKRYAGPTGFADVPESEYYAPYVLWASKYGVTSGTEPNRFSPDIYINRQQMAAFFARYFEAFEVEYETGADVMADPFDLDRVDPWARDAVLKLWRKGLLNGDGVSFNPAGSASRAQAASVCYLADEAVDIWYSEPGVASERVRIDPATGQPYDGREEQADLSKPEKNPGSGSGSSGSSVVYGGSGGGGRGHGGSGRPTPPDTGDSENPTPPDTGDSENPTPPDTGDSENPAPPTSGDRCSVRFYDGSRLIEAFEVKKGEPLGQTPSVGKVSKPGSILEGYYTDSGFTTPFYAQEPVSEDLSVYAKYESMGEAETLTIDSFAKMDQDSDVTFTIKRVSGSIPPEEAAALAVKDGSDPVTILVESIGGGTYRVYAPEGFHEGCSYELNLAEGWTFVNPEHPEADTIRTAAFSIAMEEVEDLSMNEEIRYIQDTEDISYSYRDKDGRTHDVAEMPSDADFTNGGSFQYDFASALEEDDLLCIYVGGKPDSDEDDVPTKAAVYAKVSDVDGDTVEFEPLGEEDRSRLYDIPDNFPLTVAELPDASDGTVNLSALDESFYAQMVGEEEGTAEKAKEKIGEGDFVTLYVSAEAIESEDDVYFGRITAYDPVSGEIAYEKCTARDIEDSANLYHSVDLESSDMITPEEQEEIERIVQAQVDRSDFGIQAANLLANLTTQTEGFRESMGVLDFTAVGEDGEPISGDQLRAYAGVMELDDDDDDESVEVKARVVLDPDKLHFGSKGVQLAVEVSAKFKVDGKDDGAIHFDLSATFVQELAVDPKIRGELVYKKILKIIPIPTGVQINAIVDVKSYTAMSLRADIYTVAAEDKPIWEQFKEFAKDPSTLGDIPGIPESVTSGLKTVGDAIGKIEETKAKIEKGLEDAEQLKSDLEDLWTVVETFSQDGLNRETYESACETLGQTNIAGELMDMLHLTEDDISADYIDGLDDLMDRYSKLLEKETDWVQLVDEKMFDCCTPPEFGVMVGVKGSFVVRADVNITLGSNLEYEVGKRYNFWFRVGLFKPSSGSSTMDLIDERFAFQFYVMGKLGIKIGARLKMYAAIGSVDAISVGLTAELGPYVKLWGFFIYDYGKYRPVNTQNWVRKEQMAGAVYLEFGLYLMVGVEAKALFLEYDKDFVDEEFPLLDAGGRKYYYNAAYEPLDENDRIVVYNDGSAERIPGCAVSMLLPEDTYTLRYIDLTTGKQGNEALRFDNYTFTVSDPNFRVDNVDGKPVVSVVSIPQNVRMMPCDLTITYKHGKMAFSSFDMSTTVHLAWTNMTPEEFQQVYTASVVVPDGSGGREAVWSKRVRKGTPFDLPTEEEIRNLLSWSDAKYVAGSGYGGRQTEGVTLIQNTMYDYDLGYQTYALTVNGLQDGKQKFTAQYGEPFDFSSLADTVGENPGAKEPRDRFTRFAGLTWNGEALDLSRPVTGSFAEAVRSSENAAAEARYVGEGVTATFTFTGADVEDVEVTVRSGDTPDLAAVEEAVAGIPDLTITGFYPAVGPMEGDMTYQVVCEMPQAETAPVTYNANDGSEPKVVNKPVGSVLGVLPAPSRTGFGFGGWFTDNGTFEDAVDANTIVPEEGLTLYAKWTQGAITVTFNTNGGLNLAEKTMAATFGEPYGELPEPERSGYGFRGWFTAADDSGTEITAETIVETAEDQTLYAHWEKLKQIPREVFSFAGTTTVTYVRDTPQPASYVFNPVQDADCPPEESFQIDYIRVSDEFRDENIPMGAEPVTAGAYNVHITRDADGVYDKFDQNYDNVLVIERAVRDLSGIKSSNISLSGSSKEYLTYVTAKLSDTYKKMIDLDDEAYVIYRVNWGGKTYVYDNEEVESGLLYDLSPGKDANTWGEGEITAVAIKGDVNYEDASASVTKAFGTRQGEGDTDTWADAANTDWYDETADEFTISKPSQLAGLAKLVNEGNTFEGKTVNLGADISMRFRAWIPIGMTEKPFSGTLAGGGYTISDLYCKGVFTGLFGCTSGATIDGVILEDCYFCPTKNVLLGLDLTLRGGILCYGEDTIVKNCTSNATIDGITDAALRIARSDCAEAIDCKVRPLPSRG